jgi:hypothetical protein
MEGGTASQRRGPNETLIALLFFVATLAGVGVLLWSEEQRLLDDPQAKAERGEISGVSGDSLVAPERFARAMGEVAERMGQEDVVSDLRLSPVRVDATVRDPTGNQRILSVDPGFEVDSRDFGESSREGVDPRAIDTRAPARMFDQVSRRAPAQPQNLDYFVFSLTGDREPRWSLFLDDVPIARQQWVADGRGGDVRPLGQPSAADRERTACLERARSAEESARCTRA